MLHGKFEIVKIYQKMQ